MWCKHLLMNGVNMRVQQTKPVCVCVCVCVCGVHMCARVSEPNVGVACGLIRMSCMCMPAHDLPMNNACQDLPLTPVRLLREPRSVPGKQEEPKPHQSAATSRNSKLPRQADVTPPVPSGEWIVCRSSSGLRQGKVAYSEF
jgi:hypothetical protein